MSNQWSDNLRKRMETHQEPSPEKLWEDIEQAMKQNGGIIIPPKQNKLVLWSKRLGTAAAVILAIVFIGDSFFKENQEIQITQEKQVTHKYEEILLSSSNNESGFTTRNRKEKDLSTSIKNTDVSEFAAEPDSIDKGNNSNFIAETQINQEEDTQGDTDTNEKTAHKPSDLNKHQYDYADKYDLNADFPIIRQKQQNQKWETRVYASNISSGSTKMYDGYGSLTGGKTPPDMEEDNPPLGGGTEDDPYEGIIVGNEYREVYTDIKHKQPIKIGASVNYNLDERWSLSSGINYTILSSELRSGSNNYYYISEQTLHNIGIPLNINYNVWTNKKFSFYLSVGGLVEKNISGKLTTDYILENKPKTSREDKISLDQLQWSVNSSIGVQYTIIPQMGVYIEPGISYYFSNGSEIETIYKEKPLNLDLRFGLRFSFGK